MKIESRNGWTEAIIDDNCTIDTFYEVADMLNEKFEITYTHKKIKDIESYYWDFIFNQTELTLHYNYYHGITIFPTALKDANGYANILVEQVAVELSILLNKDIPENSVSKYFIPAPQQWGLRGDPHLWRDMRQKA